MKINNVEIGLDYDPVIIAEMSGNHNQSLERALQIVDAAAESGAQILKLQTYTADTITLNVERDEFVISDEKSLWSGRSLYSLYQEAHTPWEWQKEIIQHAVEKGVECFSSVFDESSVEFLESVNIAAYKLASQEIVHLPLIQEVALTGKPMVMSTGMASLAEIDEAVNAVRKVSNSEIALLKCTSSYPATAENSNVLTIPYLRELFGCEVGLSDHTLGIGAALAAVSHGATLIEKHLTLSRSDGGVDSAFSMEPDEIKA
ncbi:MAG TPA: pseudaminic acid synthase, partial [Gammaproteobacteria bacterium]|nr:pseudaminic acid synthase [Gammaproteobacteria bacterium]